MNGAEVRKLSAEEIEVETARMQRRVYDLRCQAITEKIEDPSQFRKVRRDIARLKTEHHARQMKKNGGKA
jgi:large subunit ribosomal protein L29